MGCIHVAGFLHETNSFSSVSTDYQAFEGCAYIGGLRRGEGVLDLINTPLAVAGFIKQATSLGHHIHPLLFAFAEPSGLVKRDAFESIVEELLERIRAGPPPDAVFLDLHGAMITEHLDDGEAEILKRVRDAVGDIPIVCTLDLHGNIERSTLVDADLAAGYLTYPHVDMAERGTRLARLVDQILRGSERPALAFVKLPYLIPDQCQSTDLEPSRSLYEKASSIERRTNIWTVSLMAGFYQGDVEFAGPAIFVYASDAAAAEAAASELATHVMEAEAQFAGQLATVAEAADLAAAWHGSAPLILADIQDNPGGGAASDNVELLQALVTLGVEDAAVAMICDPDAADVAHRKGVGADVELSLGGKSMPGQEPFAGNFTVVSVNNDTIVLEGPFAGLDIDIGPSAMLCVGGVHVVVSSKPSQCLDRAFFRAHGLEPERQRVLVLKSAAHYRADFSSMAGQIVDVASNSACVADATKLPYKKLRRDVRLSGNGPTLADLGR